MFKFDEPFGFTIFCDDIRQEIGNKFSYMGVYQGVILVPQFPAIIPRFGIAITFWEPKALALTRDFAVPITVFLPGDALDKPSMSGEIPADHEQIQGAFNSSQALPDDDDIPSLLMVNLNISMSPLVIQKPGRIKVRGDYKGETVKLGSIRIETPQRPTGAPPQP